MSKVLVVTRHPALVELLRERGLITGDVEVLTHASEADVAGRHVYGVLPLNLAAAAERVTEIPLALTPELRGVELGLDTLRRVAGEARTYVVRVIE
jgi:putative CRISPR-associated protein (TIGR02620 family)